MSRTIAVLLAILAGSARAADPCEGVVTDVATRGGWTRVASNGVVTWKAPSGQEALTMAVYQLEDRYATAGQRTAVLAKSADFDRALERRLGRAVKLSPVKRVMADGVLQLCWSGEDHAAGRRFVSLSLAAGRFIQHFYYEAAGFSGTEFARNAETVFGLRLPETIVAQPGRSMAAMPGRVPGLFDR